MSKARRMRPGDTVYHRNLKKYARLIWTNATESCIVIDETEELRVTTQMLDLMLDHPTIRRQECADRATGVVLKKEGHN